MSVGDHRWFKRSTREKIPVTRDNIIAIMMMMMMIMMMMTTTTTTMMIITIIITGVAQFVDKGLYD
jgi:hypothetical protein